jgi:NTP pyrophosphatase (non-canonical NTP hydrolase)
MKPTQFDIYQCAVKRGKVTPHTTRKQFLEAIASELLELANEDTSFQTLELADIVLVCYSMAQHNGFSLDQAIENKHNYNLTRKD